MKWRSHFLRLSEAVVAFAGHRCVLAGVFAAIAFWCLFGAVLRFPHEWLLLSNMIGTGSALFVLLLMQHSQNRDSSALQVKVDELIRSSDAARNDLIAVERREVHELEALIHDRPADV
ncbi:low affinity iron permease family protein [Rhizobium sp. S163]|uniref:low affinity iron permease family protein n=1 Tax=Rhizobium sp. S163 TaxID=3055039 RepID=UPI0025AA0A44|nr:low affinity iron permease family protein [Rhizobium sp. S163]MDM9644806.1 low affinity iron permease family protein [Rhizobium sp. S163]